MQLYEKKDQRIFFALYDVVGTPKTDLLPADIILRLVKANEDAFLIKTLTTGNFGELGFGAYWIDLLATDVDVMGNLYITIQPSSEPTPAIEPLFLNYRVVPQPIVPGGDVPLCTIFGNVRDLGGVPSKTPMRVMASVLKLPAEISGNFISSLPTTAFTNEDGLFQIKLAIGATVRVEIADAGVRRQFVVPDFTSADLKDLP